MMWVFIISAFFGKYYSGLKMKECEIGRAR